MSVELYNFDKVTRKKIVIVIGGEKKAINEPTVGDYAEISKLDFTKENDDSLERLASILAPTVNLKELTGETRSLFFTLCFQALRGDFGEVKKWNLEELKQE